jgi:hypothetical protein
VSLKNIFSSGRVEIFSPLRSHGAAPAICDGAGQRNDCNFNFQSTTRVPVDSCAIPQILGCGQLERAIEYFYDELLMLTRNP